MGEKIVVFKPSREDIMQIAEGSYVVDPYGRFTTVSEVVHRGTNLEGGAFVMCRVPHGPTSTISTTFTEGELSLTLALTGRFNNSQCLLLKRVLPSGTFSELDVDILSKLLE